MLNFSMAKSDWLMNFCTLICAQVVCEMLRVRDRRYLPVIGKGLTQNIYSAAEENALVRRAYEHRTFKFVKGRMI